MAGIFNFNWAQGEDLDISLVYKTGDPTPVEVDLTGWTMRMDIGNYGQSPEATVTDGTLGADGTVNISLSRDMLLPPDGELYDVITGALGQTTFDYDLFLRDAGGKTHKILRGEIYVERSVTLWPTP